MAASTNCPRRNIRCARAIWGALPSGALATFARAHKKVCFIRSRRTYPVLERAWVHHTFRPAQNRSGDRHCARNKVRSYSAGCPNPPLAVGSFKAVVYKNDSNGFVGYGDADPSNVSSLVRGAEMRVAETRAVNRALRKAYGIGLCSVEELGSQPPCVPPLREGKAVHPPNGNGSANGQPRLRDKLCLLIRKYELDPTW